MSVLESLEGIANSFATSTKTIAYTIIVPVLDLPLKLMLTLTLFPEKR